MRPHERFSGGVSPWMLFLLRLGWPTRWLAIETCCPWGCIAPESRDQLLDECNSLQAVGTALQEWGLTFPAAQRQDPPPRVCHSRHNCDAGVGVRFSIGDLPHPGEPGHTTRPPGRLIYHVVSPTPGWLKINIDSALLPSRQAGVGIVARDSSGMVFFAAPSAYTMGFGPNGDGGPGGHSRLPHG
ncbi:hypothetical protein KSP40_PGU019994 [Platanthera guangdongensis]|uniref:Uncharacterized protein n=1 Tax=Platanthera guangdongensis TaxID=2320717 RepID=A0ABR2MK11_9ASPA